MKLSDFPLKWQVVLLVIAGWNLLILGDFMLPNLPNMPFGIGSKLALVFMISFSISALYSVNFQRHIVRKNRYIKTIKNPLLLLIAVCSFMLVGFLLMAFLIK